MLLATPTTHHNKTMNTPILPAATVVIARERQEKIEILLLRRNPQLKFAGNYWVFPGGKTESSELDFSKGDIDQANKLAAVRECREETGIAISTEMLRPISHWTTPNIHPKRFATQFYICSVSADTSVLIDQSEIVEHRWMQAEDSIELHHAGQLHIMPPTYVTLVEIARHENYSAIERYYQRRGTRSYKPHPVMHSKTLGTFLYEGDSGYTDKEPSLKECLNRCEYNDGILRHHCNLDDAL